ncbi:MAG: hypothetical protein MJ099_02295 [Clostridia bacterium]|nr:hypothetical protein [Clostridia bacterium]
MPDNSADACATRDRTIALLQDRSKAFNARLAEVCGISLTASDQAQALSESVELITDLLDGYDALADIMADAQTNVANDPLRWNEALTRFNALLPDAECFFEHLFVNHIIFSGSPWSDFNLTAEEPLLTFIAMYAALRYLLVAYMADKDNIDRMVDACGECFRIIEHANFDLRAVALLKGTFNTEEKRSLLLAL